MVLHDWRIICVEEKMNMKELLVPSPLLLSPCTTPLWGLTPSMTSWLPGSLPGTLPGSIPGFLASLAHSLLSFHSCVCRAQENSFDFLPHTYSPRDKQENSCTILSEYICYLCVITHCDCCNTRIFVLT
jgi:hypothetical protein